MPAQLLCNWEGLFPCSNKLFEDFKFIGLWVPHFRLFMEIVKKAAGIWGNSFSYTLIESKDIT